MSEPLKPCPFCGEVPEIEYGDAGRTGKRDWQVGCRNKECTVNPWTSAGNQTTLTKYWNTRAVSGAPARGDK